MKKRQTAKYKKRHKKELASRKAKQAQPDIIVEKPSAIGTSPDVVERLADAKPMSPARRAFQDL